jgi:hypothetical protein
MSLIDFRKLDASLRCSVSLCISGQHDVDFGVYKEKGRTDSYEIQQGVGAPFFSHNALTNCHSDDRNCASRG